MAPCRSWRASAASPTPCIDATTGFTFGPVTSANLSATLGRASFTYHDKATWRQLQLAGLATDVSWRNRAGEYAALYRGLMASRRTA